MKKSTFQIPKMDCPSEEQLIRMKLEPLKCIDTLQFDIPSRKLHVYYNQGIDLIQSSLTELNLGAELIGTEIASPAPPTDHKMESRLLWQVLGINFLFFVLEIITGFISNSMGLVADSLDMLADSLVYGLALFAVGGTMIRKKRIAKASGYFQLILAVFGLIEVIRQFISDEPTPAFQTMIIISLLALAGNALSLYLLQKSKSEEVHMQASVIFTSNDVVVNIGVIVAGVLVYFTASKVPDLVVGTIVFILVGRGAMRILKL
jgi:Co/Zn/Cd efflux system component